MVSKYVIYYTLTLLCFTNYHFVNRYFEKYIFNDEQLAEPKLRCIRYYDTHIYDKTSDMICHKYSYDYIVFILDRSQFIKNYLMTNAIYVCMILIYSFIISY